MGKFVVEFFRKIWIEKLVVKIICCRNLLGEFVGKFLKKNFAKIHWGNFNGESC